MDPVLSVPEFIGIWRSAKCFLFVLGLVNKLSSIFGWLRLRLAVSAKLGLPTSRPAFCFLASLVLAGAKTKPNFFTSP
ncbi:MAG TPA: hypothetical protein VMW72_25450 [Sedimentisphaerales bacterium]|nr:hypothetical protein [Sedimentisphaerales bacterium]